MRCGMGCALTPNRGAMDSQQALSAVRRVADGVHVTACHTTAICTMDVVAGREPPSVDGQRDHVHGPSQSGAPTRAGNHHLHPGRRCGPCPTALSTAPSRGIHGDLTDFRTAAASRQKPDHKQAQVGKRPHEAPQTLAKRARSRGRALCCRSRLVCGCCMARIE